MEEKLSKSSENDVNQNVNMVGLLLGPLEVGIVFTVWILAGLIGLPVFPGPTGGYILGGRAFPKWERKDIKKETERTK